MSKLFEDMSLDEKLAHIEKCQVEAVRCIGRGDPSQLADIADHIDYWGPWMLAQLRKQTQLINALRAEAELAWQLDSEYFGKDGYSLVYGEWTRAHAARLKLEDEMKL
jgi:hypothetical protein